jgi:pyrroloquinoline quinone (PQQ) biosynthesis protein C
MTSKAIDDVRGEAMALLEQIDRDPLVAAVICGSASREEYIRFLTATYHYVRWSGPLLAATAAGLERHGRQRWLVAVLADKAEQEAPHDRWVLDDLHACGHDPRLVTTADAPVSVTAYVTWSLTLAEQGSMAFLGAAYALELISMRRAKLAADNLCARSAIPGIARAVSFLSGHGDADVEHLAALDQVLDRIDDPEDGAELALSAAVLRTLYPRFFGTAQRTGRNLLALGA